MVTIYELLAAIMNEMPKPSSISSGQMSVKSSPEICAVERHTSAMHCTLRNVCKKYRVPSRLVTIRTLLQPSRERHLVPRQSVMLYGLHLLDHRQRRLIRPYIRRGLVPIRVGC